MLGDPNLAASDGFLGKFEPIGLPRRGGGGVHPVGGAGATAPVFAAIPKNQAKFLPGRDPMNSVIFRQEGLFPRRAPPFATWGHLRWPNFQIRACYNLKS